MHARVGVATPVLFGELGHDTSRQIAGGNESIRVDERSRPLFHMNEAVIKAMGSKARSLGLGVIANAIVAGQLSPFDLAALARLGHLPQVKAASILAAGGWRLAAKRYRRRAVGYASHGVSRRCEGC
jgi:hypothetical protein